MRKIMLALTVLAATAAVQVRVAGADQMCKEQAKAEFVSCKAQCKDDFQSAKFTCRDIDPECGKACLGGRQVCFDDAEAILDTGQLGGGATLDNCVDGTDGCKARLEAAKQACGAPCGLDQTCIACVNPAQAVAFTCRDTCRDSWRTNSAVITLKQGCRDTFKVCAAGCPKIMP